MTHNPDSMFGQWLGDGDPRHRNIPNHPVNYLDRCSPWALLVLDQVSVIDVVRGLARPDRSE